MGKYSRTDSTAKAIAVSFYFIEKKCGTNEAENVLLILRETYLYVNKFIHYVNHIRTCRNIASAVVDELKEK